MSLRSLLPLTVTISPDATVRVSTKPRTVFRPERLSIYQESQRDLGVIALRVYLPARAELGSSCLLPGSVLPSRDPVYAR